MLVLGEGPVGEGIRNIWVLSFLWNSVWLSFFIDQRNSEASGTAQREKEMCVGVVCQHGMGPAALSCAPRRLAGWHKDWDISLLLLLLQEIHMTCKHTLFLPETMLSSLASSKPACYSSVPLSEGFVCSE